MDYLFPDNPLEPPADAHGFALQIRRGKRFNQRFPKYVLPLLGLCIGYPAENPGIKQRFPKKAVYFEEQNGQDLEPLIAEYDEIYANYLKERLWNRRVGNWSQLAADFYRPPYNHYPEVTEMLQQQGFWSGNRKRREDKHA